MTEEKCKCDIFDEKVKFMFFHSKCCGKHWELVRDEYGYFICCEECGLPYNRINFYKDPEQPFPEKVNYDNMIKDKN